MMRPIGHFLAEFRPGVPAGQLASAEIALLPDLSGEAGPASLDAPAFDAMPALDEGDFSASAFGGADELSAEPAPDIEAVVAALQAEHEAALAAARAQWVAEESAVLIERFGQAMADLEQRIADGLAPLLVPFLGQAAQAKALDDLHEMLGALLTGGDGRAITLSGAPDLLAALQARIGDGPGLTFAETAEPDVTVALGDTRIRSQLRAFARKLDAALGA